jgi:DNA gyrase subunit A
MSSSFMDYAMSVIISRALPDARDGLKPVHRRILFAMHDANIHFNRSYVKCARVVGDVLGKYHPHGDASVYDALVRLAQDWNMRYPLIDGQGNFGSVEGDPAAAYRYTECRLQRLAGAMLADIDKETVDFVPNFDDKEREPTVLPALLPNLLVNGAAGIAVGMATNIPPHNVAEVLEAALALLKDPSLTVSDLMKFVPGPDFPTSGFIYGRTGIRQAYETGRGSIILRARTEIEELKAGKSQIVVTEVPYQVNPNRLIERMAEMVHEKKLEGISDLRNESSREGMRLVIELKRDAVPQVVLNHLFAQTALQVSFGVIMLAIVDGRPRILSLRDCLLHYLDHRRQVVTRRSLFELRQAQSRREIVEGLGLAIDQIDRIIAIIRAAKDPAEAKDNLMAEPLTGLAEFLRRAGRSEAEISARLAQSHGKPVNFTEPQAKAILDMRLQRLTGLERDKLAEEFRELCGVIEHLEGVLSDEGKMRDVISGELSALLAQATDPRRTEIVENAAEIRLEELIAVEPMVVTLSREGYVRRVSLSEYRAQGRGGRGVIGASTKEEDLINRVFVASTHDYVLLFTNKGRVYSKRVFDFPEAASRASKGKALVNFLDLQADERVVEMLPLPAFDPGKFVVLSTMNGIVKKTELDNFSAIRSTGIIAIDIDEGDALVGAQVTNGTCDIALCTRDGFVARFREEKVRLVGRTARGVKGVRLREGDRVVAMVVLDRDLPATLVTVCEKGYGKRTPAADYPVKGRGSRGVITIKTSERNGKVVGVHVVTDLDDLILVTDIGKVIRIRVRDVRVQGRNTQGVRLIRLGAEERVVAVEALNDPGTDGEEDPLTEDGERADGTTSLPEAAEPEEGDVDAAEDLDDEDEDLDDGDEDEDEGSDDGKRGKR